MNEWIPVLAAFTGALVAGLISIRAVVIRLVQNQGTLSGIVKGSS